MNAPTPTPTPSPTPTPTPTPVGHIEGWNIVWQDEFEGTEIDRTKWTFDLGGSGWGNNEWEFYTDRTENARIEDGELVIEAREEELQGRHYTSARMKTQELHTWTYGRIEARMKLPTGQGIWPAFWMLGDDILSTGWPNSGEIDILEFLGHDTDTVHGTVHGPGYSGANGVTRSYSLEEGDFSDDYHVYGIEWQPEQIQWFVDDEVFFTLTPDDVPGDWVYDHPFFIILNLAVGGNWPGYPDETTTFPQMLRVDYVRVYQQDNHPTSVPRPTATTVSNELIRITALELEALDSGDGQQASVLVTVVDQDGNPLEGVTVFGGWSGLADGDSEELATTAEGIAGPFLSDPTSEQGVITFCVRPPRKDGYRYDVVKSVDTCASVDVNP